MQNINFTIVTVLLVALAFSQEAEPISNDSLAVLLSAGQERILDEVIYDDPTANKTLGVMFNPIAPILYKDGLKLIGGLSYFPKGKSSELSLHCLYINESGDDDYMLNVDVLNRFYFSRKYRKGFHLLYGGRFTSYRDSDFNFFGNNVDMPTREASMLGVSFGVGYRILNKKGWYWGTSAYVGRHMLINNDNDPVYGDEVNDTYLWMEFLKIGYLFK